VLVEEAVIGLPKKYGVETENQLIFPNHHSSSLICDDYCGPLI